VEKAYKKHLKEGGKTEYIELIDQGDTEGLDLLVQEGDWKTCLKYASTRFDPQIMNNYLMKFCIMNVKAGKYGETVAALAKYDPPLVSKNFKMYNALALRIFKRCNSKEISYFRKFFY